MHANRDAIDLAAVGARPAGGGGGGNRVTGRLRRGLLAALGLAAAMGVLPAPALAAQGGISVTVEPRWQFTTPGTWTQYRVVVRDDGPADLNGEVVLLPDRPSFSNAALPVATTYTSPLSLAGGGGEKTLLMTVEEPRYGYRAEVRDAGGRVVATGRRHVGAANFGISVGILSDVQTGDAILHGLVQSLGQAGVSFTRFGAVSDFPTSSTALAGLGELVIDDFDSGALTPEQVRAIRDFVDFGGSLVLGGGAGWRRTVLPLPAELTPLRPSATGSAPLLPLADLAAQSTDLVASVATGRLSAGRSVLQGAGQPPLVIEAPFGAGRIVQLAFDPFAEPIASSPSLATVAWNQALVRAVPALLPLDGTADASVGRNQRQRGTAGLTDEVWKWLQEGPESPVSSLGLLALLLAGYLLIAGPLSYLVLKLLRRRQLMWATVPLLALAFSAAGYRSGSASHGDGLRDQSVQVQTVGDHGDVAVDTFHSLLVARRGDHRIQLDEDTLASTVAPTPGGDIVGADDLVTLGRRAEVDLPGVAIWDTRTLHTLTVRPQAGVIEAHLRLAKGQLLGIVTNHGPTTIRHLQAFLPDLERASLAGVLAPGASATVQSFFVGGTSLPADGQQAEGNASPTSQQLTPAQQRELLARLAAERVLVPGGLAMVGEVEGQSELAVDGVRSQTADEAEMAQAVGLESSDRMFPGAGTLRLVGRFGEAGLSRSLLDVSEVSLPHGVLGTVTACYYLGTVGAAGDTVEVFDWSTHAWRRLPPGPGGSRSGNACADLRPGEVDDGLIRFRAGGGASVGDVTVGD